MLFLSVLAPNRGIRNASWGNGDYMFVWHDVFSTANFPFVTAFKFHRPFFKVVSLDKDPIYWAAVSSEDLKGATMLLVVYCISFFLFCHHTGECIVRIPERTRYYQPIFNCIFFIFEWRTRTGLLRASKTVRVPFLTNVSFSWQWDNFRAAINHTCTKQPAAQARPQPLCFCGETVKQILCLSAVTLTSRQGFHFSSAKSKKKNV